MPWSESHLTTREQLGCALVIAAIAILALTSVWLALTL